MSLRDIVGVAFCAVIYILPVVIILLFAFKWLYKRFKWRRKMKMSEMLEKHCKGCMHVYTGNDYLSHCDLMTNTGLCNPKTMRCFKRP